MNNMAEKIRERMNVVASDGSHVGTVDHVDGDRIKLTRSDPGSSQASSGGASQRMGGEASGASQSMAGSSQGQAGGTQGGHRYLSISAVASVEGDTVRLSGSGKDAEQSGGQETTQNAVPRT